MTNDRVTPEGPESDGVERGEDVLIVHIGAGAGEPERLLHLSRPVDGLVRFREWTGHDWNTAAVEREMSTGALLRAFEEAARERRRMSEALYAIRLWLAGHGS